MSIPYRTRRKMKKTALFLVVLAVLLALAAVAFVVYLERYIVYTRQGVVLDMEMDPTISLAGAVEAAPPAEDEPVEIYYNEGENAVAMNKDLEPVWGYYITTEDLVNNIALCRERIALLESGTAVMIELKNGFGTFNYETGISSGRITDGIDPQAVSALIQDLNSRNLYVIGRISAFRDRDYGLNHVTQGIYHVNKKGLWPDDQHCYWMNPTNQAVLSYVCQVLTEVKAMGFDEIVLADFKIPGSDKALFTADKSEALATAAEFIMTTVEPDTFNLSFMVDSAAFQLPGERSRIYLDTVAAERVGAAVSVTDMEKKDVFLVFVATSADTRYDDYGVLRPLAISDVLGGSRPE